MLNENNDFGASFSYNRLARNDGSGTQIFHTMQNETLKESSVVDFQDPGQSTTYSGNTYYVGKIGPLQIDWNTDYYWYGKKDWMNVHETMYTTGQTAATTSDVTSNRNARNSMIASKLAMNLPLFKGTLSFGGEYSIVNRRMKYLS